MQQVRPYLIKSFFIIFFLRYNATIGVLVLIIIVVNILATSFGGPGEECVHPLVPVAHGEVEEGSGFD